MPTINITSVLVDDQAKALAFYTDILGFVKKTDIDLGAYRWLTVVSPQQPDGVELLLEPDAHPAAATFKAALRADSMAFTSFAVDDLGQVYDDLRSKGVTFIQPPTPAGGVTMAVLDDTCGNFIALTSPVSLAEPAAEAAPAS
ncbi:VOC family protein [Subtercola endophyticus]|uniref:VOC family protein n=1 Tax=Subtercola endophyticus TaxID=2895559 RepID=UPI001E419A3E|nr:VOC family protein [Subtercola endophyticus]UFS57651.1 VOC family protein [Subtercola endophyticus]